MNDLRFVNILDADSELKELVRRWRNSDAVRTGMLDQHVISEEEHSRWLDRLAGPDGGRFWAVFYEGDAIGAAYLQRIDGETMNGEWGFYIGDGRFRGKGLAKRILYEFLEKAFTELKLNTLSTKVLAGNARALRIYRKFNFRETGSETFEGIGDVLLLEYTKGDWAEARERLRDELLSKVRK